MATTIIPSAHQEKELHLKHWVRGKLGGIEHELRVISIAAKLFDVTRRWHALGAGELRLLTLAALVHDVGRAVCAKGHAKEGARMITESKDLPLGEGERRRLAFLTRYHRGAVPEAGDALHLDAARDDVSAARVVLGLLRAADGLDARSGSGAQLVVTVRARVVTIYGYFVGDAVGTKSLPGKKKKMRLLEETLGCQIKTEWFRTDGVAMVS